MTRSAKTDSSDDPLLRVLQEGVPETFPSAVTAIGASDGIERTHAVGTIDPDGTVPATMETVFDAASITKAVVTTAVVVRLIERGRLALSESLGDHLPALAGTERGSVTLRELLTHASGLQAYHYDSAWDDPRTAREAIYAADLLEAAPGERYEYSCLNFVHLAAVATAVTGRSLSALAEEHVFEPVGMANSRLGPLEASGSDDRVAWTYDHEREDRPLHGEIHDPIGRAMAGESGNAGLFTTAGDLARFARMLLQGGELEGDRVLSPATVAALRRDWTPDLDTPHGLGWRIATEESPALTWTTGESIGHTGYTGTSLWIDFARDRFAVLLTNQVFTGKDDDMVNRREKFHAIVGAERY